MACPRCEVDPVYPTREGAKRPDADEDPADLRCEPDELFQVNVRGTTGYVIVPHGFASPRICSVCTGVYFPREFR
jgi:hypothetical protein